MKKIMIPMIVSLALASCNMGGSKVDSLAAKNMAAQQKFNEEVMNKHNLAMIDSLVAPDYVEHNSEPGYTADRAGLKKSFEDFVKAFPDMHEKVNFMIADSNMVTVQYTFTGTSSGMMGGAGKKVNIEGVDIVKYKDGKAIGHWGYNDEVTMMTQMGLMPSMGGGSDSAKKGN